MELKSCRGRDFSSPAETLGAERKQLRQQTSLLPGCIGDMPEALCSSSQKHGGNGTSNIWSTGVRKRREGSWPRMQEQAVCRDVSGAKGRGGMAPWLGARGWKTADCSSSIPGSARLPVLCQVPPRLGPAPRPPAGICTPSPHRQSSEVLVYGPGCLQPLPQALPKAVTKTPGVPPSCWGQQQLPWRFSLL